MDLAYAASDVVVSRAGAMTCTEILNAGKPSILVLFFIYLFFLVFKLWEINNHLAKQCQFIEFLFMNYVFL